MTTLQICLLLLLCVINFPLILLAERAIPAFGIKPVYAIPVPPEQRRREIRNAILGAPLHPALFAAAVLSGAMRLAEETWLSVAATFAVTFVWTEIYHYAQHRAMHLRALHFMHREHHRSRITNPWTAVSFAFAEEFFFGLGILGFMTLASRVVPVSFVGIVAWYLLYHVTNTLGHANVEVNAPGYDDTWMGKLFLSSTSHAMHHARYIGNYGLLTVFMDRAFGTMWTDTGQVQSEAARGHPLSSLGQRFEGADTAA
jgi:Delta7-sterol 5-desaturase